MQFNTFCLKLSWNIMSMYLSTIDLILVYFWPARSVQYIYTKFPEDDLKMNLYLGLVIGKVQETAWQDCQHVYKILRPHCIQFGGSRYISQCPSTHNLQVQRGKWGQFMEIICKILRNYSVNWSLPVDTSLLLDTIYYKIEQKNMSWNSVAWPCLSPLDQYIDLWHLQ